jgi:hypothetical protein
MAVIHLSEKALLMGDRLIRTHATGLPCEIARPTTSAVKAPAVKVWNRDSSFVASGPVQAISPLLQLAQCFQLLIRNKRNRLNNPAVDLQ